MTDTRGTAQRATGAAPGLILLLCCGATFMAFLDLSVVNIAFPKIIEEFPDASLTTLTWVVSGYAVMFAAFLSPAGRLADTVGRRGVFLWSVAGFGLASVVCGVAPSEGWLIAGRFGQGAMAAGMIPAALGLILSSTPMERMTKAIGAWSAAAGFSAVIGPVVGGLLVEQFSWRSVFLINIPIGLVLVLAGLRSLPAQGPAAGRVLPDFAGTVAFACGVGAVVAALTESHDWGWTSVRVLGLLVGGAALCAYALARSARHAAPAVDLSLWRHASYARCNIALTIFSISMFAYILAGALFATAIWHYSILKAAGALSVGAGTAMIGSIIAGGVTRPAAQRALMVLGSVMFAICTAMMSTSLFGTHPRFWAAWVPAGLIGGTGIGLAVTSLSAAAAAALPPARFAAGIGMTLTVRQIGGALGIATLAVILARSAISAVGAFHTLYQVITAVSLLAALAALTIRQQPRPVAARQADTAVPAADRAQVGG
jgi:EmrB/QacA subfamily drug resistance transporter